MSEGKGNRPDGTASCRLLTRFLDGIEPFELPVLDRDLVVVCGRVGDHSSELLTAERVGLERMGDVRRAEYSSGRRVARGALGLLGIADQPVTSRARVPVWPPGVVGSITHSRTLALAVIGRTDRVRGIGVDVERERRVYERIAARVLLPRECENLAQPDWPTMLFAAKEAVYKAVNPLVGEYLEFTDVEIVASTDGTYRAAMTRPGDSKPVVEAGRGWFQRVEGHWLCVFLVPDD